ncbi:MAG: signal peptide peptidase SppA [Candidatus Anstonellales archaeon]
MKIKPNKITFGGSFGLLIVALLLLLLVLLPFVGISNVLSEKCIGLIEIKGEIKSESIPPTLFFEGVAGSEEIAKLIKTADENPSVGAIVVSISSPGGSPVGAREIYNALRSAKKPTVAYFREIATSGGYYAGMGADYIVAERDAITGSIGVRSTIMEVTNLFGNIGINSTLITSGKFKGIADPTKKLTDEEKEILQTIVDEVFEGFKHDLIEARSNKLKDPQKAFDARILSGKQAYDIGLVDMVGGKDDALKTASQLADIKSESPRICKIEKPSTGFFTGLLGEKWVGGLIKEILLLLSQKQEIEIYF